MEKEIKTKKREKDIYPLLVSVILGLLVFAFIFIFVTKIGKLGPRTEQKVPGAIEEEIPITSEEEEFEEIQQKLEGEEFQAELEAIERELQSL